jgi:hypothetical protein
MGLLGILVALGLLIWLAYRGWSVLLLAPAASIVAAGLAGEPDTHVAMPRIRARRNAPWRGGVPSAALFPGYRFVLIEPGWWAARWCPGVISPDYFRRPRA